jgi:hypothetical protein
MFVVLDTNSFHGDPMLRGRNFRLMRAEQERGALQIVIPKAVRAELPKRFREQLMHASTGANKALTKLAALDVKTPTLELPDIEAASRAYPLLLKAGETGLEPVNYAALCRGCWRFTPPLAPPHDVDRRRLWEVCGESCGERPSAATPRRRRSSEHGRPSTRR